MAEPHLTFLTDFGDTAPATCRGVIWSILPGARINDLAHGQRPYGVRAAAFLLWSSLPYQPVGVHLAVVDPGVGTERRPIALQAARGDLLVGPDNGLLVPAAERLGGIERAHVLSNRSLWRQPVSHTFHGRDIFAPVAAHLAGGVSIAEAGDAIDPATLVRLPQPEPRVDGGALESAVLFVDSFGNCRIAGQPADLAELTGRLGPGDAFNIAVAAGRHAATWQLTFGAAAPGALLLYEDADYAGLAIGVNLGSAAERLGLAEDDAVRIAPA